MKIHPALVDAFSWFVVVALTGASSVIAGTYLLAGLAIALVITGAFLLSAAAYIRRGLNNG